MNEQVNVSEDSFYSVSLFTLKNENGMQVKITNWGARITEVRVPDKEGNVEDVVLGHQTLKEYVNAVDKPYFGATVGRYGNRIAKGRFVLDGKEYQLLVNDGPNHLHGGAVGFDKVIWDAQKVCTNTETGVRMTYRCKDGEENYPGNLDVSVTFYLTADNEIKIHYEATTDASTPLNPTNHSYFNLKGEGSGDILNHEMMINADRFTPIDATLIPTGELQSVTQTPFDFRERKSIGRDISRDDEQLRLGGGYDHNFVLNKNPENPREFTLAVKVYEPESGRVLEALTDQPGVQFYTGNYLDGRLKGKSGCMYNPNAGFCLETQHFPDSPNQKNFPSTILRPEEKFDSVTVYRFSW